jgi:hypothetical protein
MKKSLLNEVRKFKKAAGILKEDYNKPTAEDVEKYWSIMVDNQPEDVIRVLTDLTIGQMSFNEFVTSTSEDVFDSFRDDLYNDESD